MFGRIFGAPQPAPKPTIWRYARTVLYDRLLAFAMLAIVLLLLVALFIANLVYHGTQEQLVNKLPLAPQQNLGTGAVGQEPSSSTGC